MPSISRQTTVPANGTEDLVLSPFGRFAGGGGRLMFQSTVPFASAGVVSQTILVGSDVLVRDGAIYGEDGVGFGPNAMNTPKTTGVGAPGDPITVTFTNTSGAPVVVRTVGEIENA